MLSPLLVVFISFSALLDISRLISLPKKWDAVQAAFKDYYSQLE